MATKKKAVRKKRIMSAAQKAALAKGRAKLRAKRPVSKTRRKAVKSVASAPVALTVYKKRKKATVSNTQKTGVSTMARKRRSVKSVASGARRKTSTFLRNSDATGMLKNAGLAIAGGIGAGFLASKLPVTDNRVKSAIPIAAGILLSGTIGRKNKMAKGVAEGMVILGAVSLFKALAPNVPMLAGDGPQCFIPTGYPYQPQLDDMSGEPVRLGKVVQMGADEYYSPANI